MAIAGAEAGAIQDIMIARMYRLTSLWMDNFRIQYLIIAVKEEMRE